MFLVPKIEWSQQGGFSVSLTGIIGIYKGLSAQVSIGYSFGSDNFYVQGGASLAGITAYGGWASQGGLYGGLGYGIGPSGNGLSSNMSSAGINYSQNGGWGGNLSTLHYNQNGGFSYNLSIGYSHTLDIYAKTRFSATIDGSDLPKNEDGSVFYNNETAKLYWDYWFGKTNGLRNLYADGSNVNGVTYNLEKGYYTKDKEGYGGFTVAVDRTRSDVYLSKVSFRSQWKLYNVMGHERIHVLHYYHGLMNENKSEFQAYSWNVDQGLKYRSYGDSFWGYSVSSTYLMMMISFTQYDDVSYDYHKFIK